MSKARVVLGMIKPYQFIVQTTKCFRRAHNGSFFFWISLLFIAMIAICYVLFDVIGVANYFSGLHKVEIQKQLPKFFGLTGWACLLCFFHFRNVRNRKMEIVSMVGILFFMVLGSRALFATALVGALISKSFDYIEKNQENNNRRIIIYGILIFLFLILYKLIYEEVRAGNLIGVIDILGNLSTWINLFDIAELRIVCANYNYIIDHEWQLPVMDVVARLSSVVPFANNYFQTVYPLRFSAILMEEIHTTYGLASNCWGEIYAMSGSIIAVLVATAVWLTVIQYLNDRVRAGRSPFALAAVSYLSFYIHRLDWTEIIGCFKMVVLFFLVKLLFDITFGQRRSSCT